MRLLAALWCGLFDRCRHPFRASCPPELDDSMCNCLCGRCWWRRAQTGTPWGNRRENPTGPYFDREPLFGRVVDESERKSA